jgi:ribosomal protein L37E
MNTLPDSLFRYLATGETPPDRPCNRCGKKFHNVLVADQTTCPDCFDRAREEREHGSAAARS